VGLRVLRFGRDGTTAQGGGFADLAAVRQLNGQIGEIQGPIRRGRDGAAVVRNRIGRAALLLEQGRQVVVRLAGARIERQDLPVGLDGLALFAPLLQRQRERAKIRRVAAFCRRAPLLPVHSPSPSWPTRQAPQP